MRNRKEPPSTSGTDTLQASGRDTARESFASSSREVDGGRTPSIADPAASVEITQITRAGFFAHNDETASFAFLPAYFVSHLPEPLSQRDAINKHHFRLLQLEDIRHEQEDWSYQELERIREQWALSGRSMVLIEWLDGTLGIMKALPLVPATDIDVMRAYCAARRMRELREVDEWGAA